MMKKPITLTFIAAAVLFAASVTTYVYGQHMVLSRRLAEEDAHLFTMTACGFDPQLESWEKAAGLIGLMAFSTFIAGGLFWNRETQPEAGRCSILGINEIRARRIVRETAPCESVVPQTTNVDGSYTRQAEDDYLTPLERVIRGY